MKERLGYIDGLRGIAVLLVLLIHNKENVSLSYPATFTNLIENGKYGVQLFYVISAYTIFLTYKKEGHQFLNFFIKRFFRIFPLYCLAVFTYSQILSSPTEGVLLNYFLLHAFSPKFINSVVPGGWSVGIEWVFYAIAPILIYKINTLNRSIWFLIGTLLISVLFEGWFKTSVAYQNGYGASFLYFSLPNQLPVFALGVFTFNLLNTKNQELLWRPSSLLLFSLLFLSFMVNYPLVHSHVFAGVFFMLFFIINSRYRFKLIDNGFLRFIGKLSFGMYLTQYLVIYIISSFNIHYNPGGNINNILQFFIFYFIFFALTFSVSLPLYYLLELPMIKLGRRIISYFELRQSSP